MCKGNVKCEQMGHNTQLFVPKDAHSLFYHTKMMSERLLQ
jgi:hypothetical protein